MPPADFARVDTTSLLLQIFRTRRFLCPQIFDFRGACRFCARRFLRRGFDVSRTSSGVTRGSQAVANAAKAASGAVRGDAGAEVGRYRAVLPRRQLARRVGTAELRVPPNFKYRTVLARWACLGCSWVTWKSSKRAPLEFWTVENPHTQNPHTQNLRRQLFRNICEGRGFGNICRCKIYGDQSLRKSAEAVSTRGAQIGISVRAAS